MKDQRLWKKEKKVLSAKGLLNIVRKQFSQIVQVKSSNRGRPKKISLADCLMSALSMFGLKSPSLLSFDKSSIDPIVANNLKRLYGIKIIPSDTHMRKILDEINPKILRKIFTLIFNKVQRSKLLKSIILITIYIH